MKKIIQKIKTLFKLIRGKRYDDIAKILLRNIPVIAILNRPVFHGVRNLIKGYGYGNSFKKNFFLLLNNESTPWMTYPFIDYIKNLDLSEKIVFEYGSGASTIFWGQISKEVVSIENDEDWYNLLKGKIKPNTNLKLRKELSEFIEAINEDDKKYDIIIIDGGSNRYECAIQSVSKLNNGGIIVLDDSDNIYYNRISDFLKSNDLIQIDFVGLKPRSTNIVSTSLFLKRDFNFSMSYEMQPKIFVGNNRNYVA